MTYILIGLGLCVGFITVMFIILILGDDVPGAAHGDADFDEIKKLKHWHNPNQVGYQFHFSIDEVRKINEVLKNDQ